MPASLSLKKSANAFASFLLFSGFFLARLFRSDISSERLYNNEDLTIYGDGEQTRDFVNVKDVALANYLGATKATESAAYNVGSGTNITINHLANLMKSIFKGFKFGNGFLKINQFDRFEKIINGKTLKGPERVLVVCGDKDNHRQVVG